MSQIWKVWVCALAMMWIGACGDPSGAVEWQDAMSLIDENQDDIQGATVMDATVMDAIEDTGFGSDSGLGAECRREDDCEADLVCNSPYAIGSYQGCGIPPTRHCDSDSDSSCYCHAILDVCSPTLVGSECKPSCQSSLCSPGFVCQGHVCRPQRCDDGFACSWGQACDLASIVDEGPVWTHTHGCVWVSCEGDGDCEQDLFCVNAFCRESLGTCGEWKEHLPVP